MKALSRRMGRIEELAQARLRPRSELVTADELEWVRSLGCGTHEAEKELGTLRWDSYVVRFTTDELQRIYDAGRRSVEGGP